MSKRLISESSSCRGKEPIVAAELEWWDNCDPAKFRQEFRMNWSTFDFICNELQPFSITNTKKVSTSDFRRNVAALVWSLASGQPNKDVEARFGITYTQCRVSLNTFVGSLMRKYVNWPDESEMVNIKNEFERVSGLENVVGSISTTRIQVAKPSSETFITADPYYDDQLSARNSGHTSYSIALQVVVNHKGVFTDISVGEPGSLTDYQVYQRSSLSDRVLQQGDWIASTDKFPLSDEILAPYINYENLTRTQQIFDDRLSRIESIAKEACLRLKSRWLILKREKDHPTLETVGETVKACCILHNICAIKDDVISPRWRFDVEDNDIIPEPPVVSEDASNRRDALAEDLQLRLNI